MNSNQAKDYIKSKSDILSVANLLGVNLKKQGKNTYVGNCPTGHPSNSGTSFHMDTEKNLFYCFNCGVGGDVISLVRVANKTDFIGALTLLRNNFAPETKLSNRSEEISEEEELAIKKIVENSFLYEEILAYGKTLLYGEEGKKELEYLINERKYSVEVLKETEWFYLPKEFKIKEYLMEKYPERRLPIANLQLQGFLKDNFRLVFPYRDSNGLITGLVKRHPSKDGYSYKDKNGEEKHARYDSTYGLKKTDLFGLHSITDDKVIIVEGYPDALYLKAAGIDNITAIGQGNISESHIKGLNTKSIKNVMISFDNDAVGPKNSVKAIMKLLSASNITPYVVDPKELGRYKDPDEYFRDKGVDELNNLFISKAEDGLKWILKYKVEEFKSAAEVEKSNLKDEILGLITLRKFDEAYLEELHELVKIIFGDKFADFKKLIKENRKIDLKKIVKQSIVPITDMTSNSRGYYNKEKDEFIPGVKNEVIMDILANHNIEMPDRLPVFSVVFDPRSIGEKFSLVDGTLNLFSPTKYMQMKPTDEKIELDVKCPRIFTLINNLIPVEDEREHFLNWLAYAFTKREKMRTAFVFKGAQGSGKNLFFEKIIRPLFGEKQTMVVDDDRLQSDYNGYITNKLFIAFNEVGNDSSDSRRGVKSKLKAIITEQKILINLKYINTYEADNFANIIFFTNEILPVLLEEGDRRYNIIETGGPLKMVSSFRANPEEYIMDMEKELPKFAQYLLKLKIDLNKIDTVITNEAKARLTDLGMNKYQTFALKLKAGDLDWFEDNLENYKLGEITRSDIELKRIEKNKAIRFFNNINNLNCSMTKLTQMLNQYEIKTKRERNEGIKDIHYYFWN